MAPASRGVPRLLLASLALTAPWGRAEPGGGETAGNAATFFSASGPEEPSCVTLLQHYASSAALSKGLAELKSRASSPLRPWPADGAGDALARLLADGPPDALRLSPAAAVPQAGKAVAAARLKRPRQQVARPLPAGPPAAALGLPRRRAVPAAEGSADAAPIGGGMGRPYATEVARMLASQSGPPSNKSADQPPFVALTGLEEDASFPSSVEDATARMRHEVTLAAEVLAEDARLRELHAADTQVLSRLQELAARLRGQNAVLAEGMRRAEEEAQRLQQERAFVHPAVEAPLVPEQASLVSEDNPLHGFAKTLNEIEQGQFPQKLVIVMIVILSITACVLFLIGLQGNFPAWTLSMKVLYGALLVIDIAFAWTLAQKWGCTTLLYACALLGVPLISCVGGLWETFQLYDGRDLDGDGDVDWRDRLHAFKKTGQTFVLLYQTGQAMLPLFAVAAGGFAFLWYIGALQLVLKQLLVYAFLAVLLVVALAMFIYRIWRSLNTSILQFFEQFKQFQHLTEDVVQNIPEMIKRQMDQYRGELFGGPPRDEGQGLHNVHDDPLLLRVGHNLYDVSEDPFLTAGNKKKKREQEILCEFAEALFEKFKTVEDAFRAFDVNQNGLITRAEFRQSARQLPKYTGDAMEVFRALAPTRESGRFPDRLGFEDFRRLARAHEEQAEARKALDSAIGAVLHALQANVKATQLEAAPLAGQRGGEAWHLRNAFERAKMKAVGQISLREAEHALEAVECKLELERALAEYQQGGGKIGSNRLKQARSHAEEKFLKDILVETLRQARIALGEETAG